MTTGAFHNVTEGPSLCAGTIIILGPRTRRVPCVRIIGPVRASAPSGSSAGHADAATTTSGRQCICCRRHRRRPRAAAATPPPGAGGSTVHSAFAFGAVGDGRANDTAAIQRTIDAAGASGRGSIALLPANGTFLLGGGIHLLGHAYDGVSLTVDGKVTIPTPAWSTPAQAGKVNDSAGVSHRSVTRPLLTSCIRSAHSGSVQPCRGCGRETERWSC
jgi:hypothetical protein